MKQICLGSGSLRCSRLAYGCWRIAGSWDPAAVTAQSRARGRLAVLAAYEAGYTLFDHADIYCHGIAEQIFGEVLAEVQGMRQEIVIATKCGIRLPTASDPACVYRYDFSPDYIIQSCEQSLRRLGVETIDLYQLHRPDYLMHPEVVAEALTRLRDAGKVREFGVSNFRPSQLALLQRACPKPLSVHQVEISLAKLTCLDDGTLDQCLAEHLTPLAWSPLGGGALAGGAVEVLPSQKGYGQAPLLEEVDRVARVHQTSRSVVALAWLLQHPSGIVPIVGSTDPDHIRQATQSLSLNLSHADWYRLLVAARGESLP